MSDQENPLVDDDWQKETASFQTPGKKEKPAAPVEEEPAGEEPPAEVDVPGEAEDPPPSGDDTIGDDDVAAQAEIEGKSGRLPDWMKKRIDRAQRRVNDATAAAEEERQRRIELEERIAALEAERARPVKEPDPDDYYSVAEYEEAKAAYDASKKATKEKPKKEKKEEGGEGDLALPAHIEAKEFGQATEFILEGVDADTKTALLGMKVLPPDVILAMHDVADGDAEALKEVAEFVVSSPAVVEAIADLPVRQRNGAFERAFSEGRTKKPAAQKSQSKAPPPITRVKGGGRGVSVPDDFRSFEEQRNAEEIERRGVAY